MEWDERQVGAYLRGLGIIKEEVIAKLVEEEVRLHKSLLVFTPAVEG